MTDLPAKKFKRGPGLLVQCIGCKSKRILDLDEAAALKDQPTCDRCYMPMVAVEART